MFVLIIAQFLESPEQLPEFVSLIMNAGVSVLQLQIFIGQTFVDNVHLVNIQMNHLSRRFLGFLFVNLPEINNSVSGKRNQYEFTNPEQQF
jgi:hypothetical protein